MTQITSDTVFVDARVPVDVTNTSRHCCYRITGAQGKRFRCAIGIRSNWSHTALSGWYRLVWSYDVNGDDWRFFDSVSSEGDYWVGVNNEPFTEDEVYVASLPVFTLTQMQQRVDDWISNSATEPTESGDSNYIIGSVSAATGPDGKSLPEVALRAFKVGIGSVKVALTSGAHPQELGEWFLEAAVDQILEDSEIGAELRSNFTFYVYTSINPHGQFGGYVRKDPETGQDANRNWGDSGYTSQIKTIFEGAWAQDLTDLGAHIDYHSVPVRNVTQSDVRELWTPVSDPGLNSEYIAALGARTSFAQYDSTASDAVRGYIAGQFGAQVSAVAEHTHASRSSLSDWRQWGRDTVLALNDIATEFEE